MLNSQLNKNIHVSSQKRINKNGQSRKTVSAILQPQQPINYLTVTDKFKEKSLISCKSQPQKVKKCKNHSNQIQSHSKVKQNDKNINKADYQTQRTQRSVNNKSTRKYLTKKIQPFQNQLKQQKDNDLNDDYYKIRKTRRNNNQQRVNLFQDNQKTIKFIKTSNNIDTKYFNPSSEYKNNQNYQKNYDLQNLKSRMKICETYIEIQQRRAALLSQQVNFLMLQQYKKQIKKSKKSLKSHNYQNIKSLEHFNQKSQSHTNKNNVSHRKNQLQSNNQLSNKFHYRSVDQKESRMRQLIYFHQNQYQINRQRKVKTNNKKVKETQKNKNKKRQKRLSRQNGIQQVEKNNHKRANCKHHRHNKKDQNLQIQKDPQSSSYLLEQSQNQKHSRVSHFQINPQLVKKAIKQQNSEHNQPLQLKFNYVQSERVYNNSNSQQSDRNINQKNQQINSQRKKNEKYLTQQFYIDDAIQISRKRNDFKMGQPQEQYHSSGYFNEKSKNYEKSSQKRIQNSFYQNHQTNKYKFCQNESKYGKFNNSQVNQNHIKSYANSNKKPKERQHQYEIVQSNKSSFDKSFQKLNIQHLKKRLKQPIQSDKQYMKKQLINRFDNLVLAAANEQTLLNKKIIRQQIYRTSKQINQLQQSVNQNNQKYKISSHRVSSNQDLTNMNKLREIRSDHKIKTQCSIAQNF